MKKRLISVLLSVVLLVGMFSVGSVATAQTSGDFEFQILEGRTAEITDYTGNDSVLVIPSNVNGYTVTRIAANAINNKLGIVEIVIPSTVKSIGEYAFSGCHDVSSVKLSEGVKIIEYGAFYALECLREVTIPKSVIVISDFAFGSCDPLRLAKCYRGSAGESFAKARNLQIEYLSDRTLPTTAQVTQATPAKVKMVTVKSKAKKKVTVTWKAAKNAKKYIVKYSYKSNMKSAKTKTVAKLKVTLKKLKSGKRVYVQVQGINGETYGAWSAKKRVRVK